MSTTTTPSPEAARQPRRWRRGRGLAIAIALAVVVAIAAAVAVPGIVRAVLRPDAFHDAASGTYGAHEPVGRTAYIGALIEHREVHRTVTITGIEPVVGRNTAAADFDFFLCVNRTGRDAAGVGYVHEDSLDQSCATMTPIDGDVDVALNANPPQQVLLAVTGRRPGVVVIRGVDVTYRDGWHRGTQRAGDGARIVVEAGSAR